MAGIKKFRPIVSQAQKGELREADTVNIVRDIFSELFGYDRYSEITSEHAIKGTYVDLAIKVQQKNQSKIHLIVEVKGAYKELSDGHVRQATDYAIKEGIDWVVLTNCVEWRVYKIKFGKPAGFELVQDFSLKSLNGRSSEDLGNLYLLTKEGCSKSALNDYLETHKAIAPENIGAILLHESCLNIVRKNLRKCYPDQRVSVEDLEKVLTESVIRPTILDSDELKRKHLGQGFFGYNSKIIKLSCGLSRFPSVKLQARISHPDTSLIGCAFKRIFQITRGFEIIS